MLASGNQAIVKGAVYAGASYLAAYPITPASDIMMYWIKEVDKQDADSKQQKIFLQSEDEIAAIHSIIGASLAGRKAFTPTSGPGVSLMQEGIGLASVYRTPLVMVNVQRQGPSTGMPTMFSQDGIMQTQYGSHGDRQCLVFYPNSVQECYDLAIDSFNAASESSSPVVLLSDAYIARLNENVEYHDHKEVVDFPYPGVGSGNRHYTGLTTNESNLPDTKNPKSYLSWQQRIQQPILDVASKYQLYQYEAHQDSQVLLIAFGMISRIVLEFSREYSVFRPALMFPMVSKLVEVAKKYQQIIVIEGNQGQYQQYLQAKLKRSVDLVSVQGGQIKPQDIYQQIKKLEKNHHE